MATMRLGKTELRIEKNGFGCLPIQRVDQQEAAWLLHRAVEGGMTFFDTARAYTDSEEKMGCAFRGMRQKVILASKTMAKTAPELRADLERSLRELDTDYLDLYQLHNPDHCPRPGEPDGLYDALLEAKAQGKVRSIGVTNHRLHVARAVIESGLYDCLQFPFSYLAVEEDEALVTACRAADMGFIAMKGMSGGLIRNGRAAFAFLAGRPWVVPIWGVQHRWELEEFLSCMASPPALEGELLEVVENDRKELAGEFCRGCGYCMPCPVGIEINMAARMSLLMRRMVLADQMTEKGQAMMAKVADCTHCGACKTKCPYGLDTPRLLEENYADYQRVLKEYQVEIGT